MAKPRIFVSSTYYDLKYVRERIERFISGYNFDPILFESDSVLFEPNQPLDKSCYKEVELCQMMILIVGGRYGSAVSGSDTEAKKNTYDGEFISITQMEYETAKKRGMPVMIFIDQNVYADYNTYRRNKFIPDDFQFAHVDSINVFKFISKLESNAIKTFDKIEDIEGYFANQISGMLYDYLQQLQNNKRDDEISGSVSQISKATDLMRNMVNKIGEKIFKDTPEEYKKMIMDQNISLLTFFIDIFENSLSFEKELRELPDDVFEKVTDACFNTILNTDQVESIFQGDRDWETKYSMQKELAKNFKDSLYLINENLSLSKFDHYKIISKFANTIIPIIESDKYLSTLFRDKIKNSLKGLIEQWPF